MSQKLRGREGEERQIIRMLHTVTSDAGAVLHLEGGWGSGRTRLLREAADAARRMGFTVVDGDWLPGAEPPSLNGASRQPVLVVLDDLHHADPAFTRSLRTLPWRLRDRPIGWVLSRLRGAGGPAVDQLFATQPSAGRLDLRPLSPQAIRLLVADYAFGTVTALPSLLRSAGGNPALTVELVRGLHGEGLNGSVNHPPLRVQACVRRCMMQLGTDSRRLLQVGAVLGIRFELNDVALLLHRPAAELLAPLDEMLAADILGCEGDRLVFAQELFWRCVLSSLPYPAREALQQEAAAGEVTVDVTDLAATAAYDHGREPDDVTSGLAALNDIERKVAQLVSQGLTNQQIAGQVYRSPHTINYHLRQIFRKLDIHSRVELARLTLRAEDDGPDAIEATG